MAAQVTIKMGVREFDTLREAVQLAQATAKCDWQALQAKGASINGSTDSDRHMRLWIENEARYNDLLENVLT